MILNKPNNPDRMVSPALQLIDKVQYTKPDIVALSNGIMTCLIEGGSQDIIRFELLFKAGTYQQNKPLQAYATANLLKNGTIHKQSEEINQLWDFYGVSLQIEAQKDLISVGFFCLTKHLDPVLDLLFEIISQAVMPEEELELLLSNRRQKFIVNQKKVQHLARVHFNELLYGVSHPYGNLLKVEDFDNLFREDLLDYYQRFLTPSNCVCLIAGQFPGNITDILNDKIGKLSWLYNEVGAQESFNICTTKKQKHKIFLNDSLQSSIRIGKLIENRHHADYHKISITNTLLGGYFGSRLMRNIRQDKGFTYGVNSAIVALLKSAYFFISTQVGNDVIQPAVKEIYHELEDLSKRPADHHELTMLKNYLSASFLRSFDGPFMQMERFKEILLFDLDYSHYDDFLPALNELTAKEIQIAAEQYFNPSDMLELIVGHDQG
jgi:zinc protease